MACDLLEIDKHTVMFFPIKSKLNKLLLPVSSDILRHYIARVVDS